MTTTSTATAKGLTINKGLPRRLFNRLVTATLRSPLHGLFGLDRFGMLLTYTGRKTGKSYTLPLAYTRDRGPDGDTVTTFALFTNTVWWKNLRGGAPVTLRLRGRDVPGTAETVENPEEVARGLLSMAEKNPRMTRGGYYGVPRNPDGTPDFEALLDAARTRVMIHVRLTDAGPVAPGREFSPLAKRLMRAFVATHVFIYRRSGGRLWSRMGSSPVLLLTTTGRKTGERRTVPLSYFEDGDRLVVVGAMGGAPRHPAWVLNLRSDPRVLVRVGSNEKEMRARVSSGQERGQLWSRLNSITRGGFEGMQRKTTREFPLVVLEPATVSGTEQGR